MCIPLHRSKLRISENFAFSHFLAFSRIFSQCFRVFPVFHLFPLNFDQNFSDYEIEEPEVAETPSGKSYEMEIEVGEEEYEVTIDPQGNLTKKKEGEENDENDED